MESRQRPDDHIDDEDHGKYDSRQYDGRKTVSELQILLFPQDFRLPFHAVRLGNCR